MDELQGFPYLMRAMAQWPHVAKVFALFVKKLIDANVWDRACNDVSAHKPEYHQRALIPSIEFGVEAAYRLLERSTAIGYPIDVVAVLALCDVGKDRAFCRRRRNYHRSEIYSAQEVFSWVDIGRNTDDLLLIILHKLGYQAGMETIRDWSTKNRQVEVGRLLGVKRKKVRASTEPDEHWLMRFLAVLSCRCVSRGWTEAQESQRADLARNIVMPICRACNQEELGQLLCEEFILAR